MEIVTNEQGTN
jgi:hypothetical protein